MPPFATRLQSDLSVADGMPLVRIARALGLPITERVAGSSLFQALREQLPQSGQAALRTFFFGGPPGVAQAAHEQLNATPSGMCSVGFTSPGFGSIEEMSQPATIAQINDSQADFLVVALGGERPGLDPAQPGAPAHTAGQPPGRGGQFRRRDGLAGPRWAQKSGLEWLWRIKEEPQLWRRYRDDGMALLQLLVTRVLPLPLGDAPPPSAGGRLRTGRDQLPARSWRLRTAAGRCAGRTHIERLRAALAQAAAGSEPVLLDCTRPQALDSAALGSLMLLYGHCAQQGRPWAMINVSAQVQRQRCGCIVPDTC
jgi:N-acetylglucosaminyldiphosphoundecaprenol N-acetyl-beta-D-mannosaminyltransferase